MNVDLNFLKILIERLGEYGVTEAAVAEWLEEFFIKTTKQEAVWTIFLTKRTQVERSSPERTRLW